MTKKTAVLFIAAGLSLALAFPPPAGAQPRRNQRSVGLYVNLGYMNLNSYPKWVTLGPELELRLGRAVTVNPELSLWLRDFFGDTVHIVPGGGCPSSRPATRAGRSRSGCPFCSSTGPTNSSSG